jgi:hypothetical protein
MAAARTSGDIKTSPLYPSEEQKDQQDEGDQTDDRACYRHLQQDQDDRDDDQQPHYRSDHEIPFLADDPITVGTPWVSGRGREKAIGS